MSGQSVNAFESLSKEDLVAKCEELLKKNNKLEEELIGARKALNIGRKKTKAERKGPHQRPIDFSQYGKKHIAFRFIYLGWDYHGFAVQDNIDATIEGVIFTALKSCKFIEERATSKYSRCGRTDKGVSAFGQVIAIDIRTRKKAEFISKKSEFQTGEISYVKALNRILPPDVRIIAYANVPKEFDARFDCTGRTYKYFFPASNLDLEAMRQAAQRLIGEHDFRNFCKVDVGNNVNHFIRRVDYFTIRKIVNNSDSPLDMCEMEIKGKAFLWHQVRCMAAILFLVGLHHEEPEIIDYLLDIEKCPKRPQYGIASEKPLVLYDCTFDDVDWIYEKDFNDLNISKLEQFWTDKSVQCSTLQTMIDDLRSKCPDQNPNDVSCISALLIGYTGKDHIPLRERNVCGGLERHLEKLAAKRIKLEEKHHGKMEH